MAKTIWQEVMADGLEQFGPKQRAAQETTKPDAMPKDVYVSDMDKEAARLSDSLFSAEGVVMPGTPIENAQDGEVTVMPKPMVLLDPNLTEEERDRLGGTVGSQEDMHQLVANEIAAKYGPEFFSMPTEARRQIMEYETEEIIATQFGREPERRTAGSLAQGFQEGFEKNFSGSLATMVESYTGIGGRLMAKNPMTGEREFYQSYSEMIPGFDDMTYDERRKSIVAWKEKWYERNAAARDADREGAAHTVGMIGGFIADPTTLIPLGQTYKLASFSTGAIASSDMFLYDMAQRGVIEPGRIATAGVFGAIGGPFMLWAGRGIGKVMQVRNVNKALTKYEKEYARAFAQGESRDFAEIAARVSIGNMDQAGLDDMYRITGRTRVIPETPKAAKMALEERLSFFHRSERLQNLGTKLENIITPISDAISRTSTRLGQGLRKMELNVHMQQNNWFHEVNPFLRKLRKFSKADKMEFKRLVMTDNAENWGQAYTLIKKYERQGGKFKNLEKDFNTVREVIKEVEVRYKQMGFDMDPLAHYYPRVVTNPSAIKKVPYSFVQEALEAERASLGRELKPHEVGRVINYLINYKVPRNAKVKTSGSLRSREVDTLHESMLPHYAEPEAALHSYLRMAALDIERAQFLKQFGSKGNFRTSGTDIGDHVGTIIDKEAKRLGLDWKARDRLVELLQSRFTTGEASPNGFIRGFKNLGYTTTLGNPFAALTQLGDQAFGIYKNNILNHIRGILPQKIGEGRHVRKAEFGLVDAMEEIYANPSKLKRSLDFSLKWGGFNAMDRFGKESIINGALQKSIRQLRTEKGQRAFIAKWGRYFENDTMSLISDIKKFGKVQTIKVKSGKSAGKTIERMADMTDNMRLMLWHELSDVQPISLSEMPKAYLDHPNGRVFYMLKTFTVKQLDFMRREILRKFAEGKYVEGGKNLAYFATLWTLMNGTADGLKAAMVGEPFDVTDNAVDNLAQLMLWSRYSEAKFQREGAGEAIKDFLAPPTPFLDKPTQAWVRDDPMLALEPIPIVGKLLVKSQKEKQRRMEALKGGKSR